MRAFYASLATCILVAVGAAGVLTFLGENYGRDMRFGKNVSVESSS